MKSTKTTDLRLATKAAEDLYAECLLRQRYGDVRVVHDQSPNNPPTIYRFDRVAEDWLEQKRKEAGSDRRRLRAYDDARKLHRAPNGFVTFFKGEDIGSITTARIREYLLFAESKSKRGELAPTTKRNHLSALGSIFRLAHEKRLIAGVPAMPKVRLRDNPRTWFDAQEYRWLKLAAGFLARGYKAEGKERLAADMAELREFIPFMVGTFLRPSEWRELRQKHVTVHRGENTFLEIAVADGKTRPRRIISMPSVVDLYEKKIEREGADPERFLFMPGYPNRQTAYDRMAAAFDHLIETSGLRENKLGQRRVLYSLRHTSLMLRILHGDNIDLLVLARNAGTSVNQLERFYCSHLEPTMKVANLQSFKGAREEGP